MKNSKKEILFSQKIPKNVAIWRLTTRSQIAPNLTAIGSQSKMTNQKFFKKIKFFKKSSIKNNKFLIGPSDQAAKGGQRGPKFPNFRKSQS